MPQRRLLLQRIKFSLRLKLAAWSLAVFTIIMSAVLLAAWMVQRKAERRAVDARLVSAARAAAQLLSEGPLVSPMTRWSLLQQVQPGVIVLAVRDGTGELLTSAEKTDVAALPPPPEGEDAVLHSVSGERASRLVGAPADMRIVSLRHVTPEGEVRFIDFATVLDPKSDESMLLFYLLLLCAGGALVASSLTAWVVSGRVVMYLDQLTAVASQLAPENVGTRIEFPGREVEVERLTHTLNEALARLELGYRAQERFISNVAHDMKTPIAVMLTESQVIRPDRAGPGEFEAYRNSVIAEMQRLGGLVESFLTLARVDRGDALARVTDVSLLDVTMAAVSACDSVARQMLVRLVVQVGEPNLHGEDIELRGDPDLLRTMLMNLIHNAIRYSPAGEAVVVGVSCADSVAEFSVRDRGPGIPEEFHEAVFDRFFQVDSDHSRATGTGLGLAITKSIVELQGGTIHFENCPDAGCIFVVRLPLGDDHRGGATAALA